MVDGGTLAFVFFLGVSSFFSPCSVALVPAYVAYYAGAPGPGEDLPAMRRLVAGLRFGIASALGAFAIFGGIGALIYWIRERTDVSSPQLAVGLAIVAIIVAVAVIVSGVLLLLGKDVGVTLPLRLPPSKSVAAMFAFGALYSLASLGCSIPLFLAAMAQVFSQGAIGGLLVIVAYGLGLAGLLFLSAIALSLAQAPSRRILRGATRYIKPVSGVVLIGAGLYVIYYYLFVAPPW